MVARQCCLFFAMHGEAGSAAMQKGASPQWRDPFMVMVRTGQVLCRMAPLPFIVCSTVRFSRAVSRFSFSGHRSCASDF